MKFKVSEDVDAPMDLVWRRVTDFAAIEAEAKGRGAELARVGNWQTTAEGVEWRGSVKLRGRLRPVTSRIAIMSAPSLARVDTQVGGMAAEYEVSLVELRPDMTRVTLALDLSASTLSARLALQTLKLARGRVMTRLQGLIARQGNLAEDDYRRART